MAHLPPPPVWRRPLQGQAPLRRLSWGSFTPHLAHDPGHFSTPSSSPDPQGSLLLRSVNLTCLLLMASLVAVARWAVVVYL